MSPGCGGKTAWEGEKRPATKGSEAGSFPVLRVDAESLGTRDGESWESLVEGFHEGRVAESPSGYQESMGVPGDWEL